MKKLFEYEYYVENGDVRGEFPGTRVEKADAVRRVVAQVCKLYGVTPEEVVNDIIMYGMDIPEKEFSTDDVKKAGLVLRFNDGTAERMALTGTQWKALAYVLEAKIEGNVLKLLDD